MNNYFDTEEGLGQLINDNKELFSAINDIANQLAQGIISSEAGYKETLNTLTGSYMRLAPLFTQAQAYKLNEELKAFVAKKEETEAAGNKVVATVIEKESSLSVANYRKVRNLLEGYVLACSQGIIGVQTQLKRMHEDNKYKPQDNNETM